MTIKNQLMTLRRQLLDNAVMKIRYLTVLMPIAAMLASAFAVWQSRFLTLPFNPDQLPYAVGLFGPFLLAFFLPATASRTMGVIVLMLVMVLCVLLSMPAAVCASDGFAEGCQYVLALAPAYLWSVALIVFWIEGELRKRMAGSI